MQPGKRTKQPGAERWGAGLGQREKGEEGIQRQRDRLKAEDRESWRGGGGVGGMHTEMQTERGARGG